MPSPPSKSPLTYAEAGVDIDAGAALVEAIKPAARSTRRPGADAALGGFGGLFDLKAAGFKDPILVSGTDGVGTKLKLAIETKRHYGVGIDLVAMSVNDVVVQGAEPLFFLDYFATSRLDVPVAAGIVRGIADGCRQAHCALIGGETAEMPGLYQPGDYDLAGFCVGAAERGALLPRSDIKAGDIILGLASSGLHSNGFSLVRRIVAESGAALDNPAPFDPSRSLAEALLEPTRIYVRTALGALRAGGVKAYAHITGGGLSENIPRVIPGGLEAEIDLASWKMPALFQWLSVQGPVELKEMLRTLNCGIGFVAIVEPSEADALTGLFKESGETVTRLGRVTEGDGPARTRYRGMPL